MKRLVLLGASNLTNGFPTVTGLATAGWAPGPFRLLAAAGQGRAYAVWSTVLARSLPPIADCGLWRELERQPAMPTRAVLADPGNDLAYGATPDRTLAAVGSCLERLRAAGAEVLLVLPPLASIERLPPWRFQLVRKLIFPGRAIERRAILDQLAQLHRGLRRAADAVGARRAEPRTDWFSIDGIHLRRRGRAAAWQQLLGDWAGSPDGGLAGLRWRFLAAERARLFALPLHHQQPARGLADGSTISLY